MIFSYTYTQYLQHYLKRNEKQKGGGDKEE